MAWHHHGIGSDRPTSARAVLHHIDPNGPNILKGSVPQIKFQTMRHPLMNLVNTTLSQTIKSELFWVSIYPLSLNIREFRMKQVPKSASCGEPRTWPVNTSTRVF